jgi:hypothetical protein
MITAIRSEIKFQPLDHSKLLLEPVEDSLFQPAREAANHA